MKYFTNMKDKKITKAELEVLQVLWQEEACTVRQVHDIISQKREVGYTTTLKVMQVMFKNGLLDRDTEPNSHVYSAKLERDKIQQSMLGEFVENTFAGSAKNMVLQALGNQDISEDELKEIKRFIREMEKNKK